MPAEPRWITYDEIVAANEEQIDRFGGMLGIRDDNVIHRALHKPQNSYHYGGEDDLLALAVQLCVAIAQWAISYAGDFKR